MSRNFMINYYVECFVLAFCVISISIISPVIDASNSRNVKRSYFKIIAITSSLIIAIITILHTGKFSNIFFYSQVEIVIFAFVGALGGSNYGKEDLLGSRVIFNGNSKGIQE